MRLLLGVHALPPTAFRRFGLHAEVVLLNELGRRLQYDLSLTPVTRHPSLSFRSGRHRIR